MNESLETLIRDNFSWEDQMILEEAFTDLDRSVEDDDDLFVTMINKNYDNFFLRLEKHQDLTDEKVREYLCKMKI